MLKLKKMKRLIKSAKLVYNIGWWRGYVSAKNEQRKK